MFLSFVPVPATYRYGRVVVMDPPNAQPVGQRLDLETWRGAGRRMRGGHPVSWGGQTVTAGSSSRQGGGAEGRGAGSSRAGNEGRQAVADTWVRL